MLKLNNLSFTVKDEKGSKEILKNINLNIDDKKTIVITGPNGGGKSTLAKIIMGIEKPTSGEIIFNGTNITDWDITKRAQTGISFAFQQPIRFKGITVKELLSLAAGEELTTKGACEYLLEVGLCAADYVGRDVDTSLSGGEIKRIEIATILARKSTKLAIFDEPEAGIDLWSFQKLIQVFEKMHNTHHTIVIISHQERILNIADEIILIADGHVEQIGKKDVIIPRLVSIAGSCDIYKGVDK
ncbi:ABC transporter ATP-binding protein [Pectinatus sottacetonis]|uniref:ABC transporter ATP-binding protein n=1 Tax=Pectinatus sottacetonis TaxID=1002795 RepID=UPI0018C5C4A6|nr:ATP-binding cassette domain-containing protein [Pectinatus sottacetonis]